jgi:hypothetical protein
VLEITEKRILAVMKTKQDECKTVQVMGFNQSCVKNKVKRKNVVLW